MNIVTHNGPFHADDVLGCTLMALFCECSGEKHTFTRTRDQSIIQNADVVIDVGGIYDPANNRFDHHQNSFTEKRSNNVPYSSAGLIWKNYGFQIVRMFFGNDNIDFCNQICVDVDENIIQAIDALDSGYGNFYLADNVIHATFSGVISSFNPTWKEDITFDDAFFQAVNIARTLIMRELIRAEGKVCALQMANTAINDSHNGIVVVDKFIPIMENLIQNNMTFFIFPQEKDWLVQCVPLEGQAFSQRKPLPETWAGLRDADLAAVTGVQDAVFCHKGRFIAGARSKKGALDLAILALNG